MPEIIEAQLLVDGLQPVVGRTIVKVEKVGENNIIKDEDNFIEFVQGSRIDAVIRVGKRPCFTISKELTDSPEEGVPLALRTIDVFLSMSGAFMINKTTKSTRVIMTLDNGDQITYQDPRKWGRMTLFSPKDFFKKRLDTKAVDALDAPSNLLADRLLGVKDKDKSMKSILMDQGILIGLGNVYAQESLFDARIHPRTLLSQLDEEDVWRLVSCIKEMLQKSYRLGGLSLKDYVHVDGSLGTMFDETNVYRKKNCKVCNTQIEKIRQGGRSTYYCPTCQPLKEEI